MKGYDEYSKYQVFPFQPSKFDIQKMFWDIVKDLDLVLPPQFDESGIKFFIGDDPMGKAVALKFYARKKNADDHFREQLEFLIERMNL